MNCKYRKECDYPRCTLNDIPENCSISINWKLNHPAEKKDELELVAANSEHSEPSIWGDVLLGNSFGSI